MEFMASYELPVNPRKECIWERDAQSKQILLAVASQHSSIFRYRDLVPTLVGRKVTEAAGLPCT